MTTPSTVPTRPTDAIDLPSGGWAQLWEPKLLPYGRRRPLQAKAMKLWQSTGSPLDEASAEKAVTTTDVDAMLDMEQVLIVAFVRTWSHGTTPHEDPTVIDEIPGGDIDKIREIAYTLLPDASLTPAGASASNPFGTSKRSSTSGTGRTSRSRTTSSKPRGSGGSSR